MTQRKDLLDRIEVREPCTESWDEMTGNNEVRFCSHCSKNVVDLSSYTRTRAERLVRDSSGGLCVRYRKNESGRVVTAPPKFTQIKRHAKIAAGVLATTMSVASMAYTQGSPRPMREKPNAEKREKDRDPTTLQGFVVSGVVTDLHGALVVGAKVVLIAETDIKRSTVTNEEGEFRFAGTDSGNYQIEISSRNFKKLLIENVRVIGDVTFEKPFGLDVEDGIVLVGELIVTGEPIVCEDPPKVSETIETRKLLDLPLSSRTFVTMGLIPAVVEKPDNKKPAKKPKKKLPK